MAFETINPLEKGATHTATTLSLLLILAFSYQIGTTVYHLYFHPLAKYPGPKFRAFSRIPRWWATYKGDEDKVGAALHERYGPVVRVGPVELSFNTAQAWKEHAGTLKSIFRTDGAVHGRMRRTIAHAFSAQALMGQEPLMTKYFNLLVGKLHEKSATNNGVVDIMSYYNFVTFDIIGDLTFGESFGALAQGKNHDWVAAIFAGLKFNRYLRLGKAFPIFELPLRLFKTIPAVKRVMTKHKQFTIDKTMRRLEMQTDRTDFMWYITRNNHQDKEQGMTDEEICGNAGFLILAGSETTATLLAGATYLLLKNPKWLRIAQEECRNLFPRFEDINIISCQTKLPYMAAILEESLRLYPPVSATLPRLALADIVVDGCVVPAGMMVGVHHTATYSSPTNFKDPASFEPERWLKNSDPKYAMDKKDALQPFSVGPQACIGRNLAYAEMSSILARVLYEFDMELCDDSTNWMDQKMWTLRDKPPMHVKLTPRVK